MPKSLRPPLPDVEREFLGVVTLSTGTKLKVYIPTIGDMYGLDFSTGDAIFELAAKACGMGIDEYKALSIVDGMLVVSKLSNAVEALGLLGKVR